MHMFVQLMLLQCRRIDALASFVQVEILQSIKEAFVGTDALFLIVSLVEEPLQRHPRMSESDALMVQLVVAFLRNIIAIPDKAKATGKSSPGSKLVANGLDGNIGAIAITA